MRLLNFILLLLLLINAACTSKTDNSAKNNTLGDSIYFSTETESTERVKKLGLDEKKEDASYLLDMSKLTLEKTTSSSNDEYKADSDQDWVIEISSNDGTVFTSGDIEALFDKEWRSNFSSTIYGLSPGTGKWTYADAGDGPKSFSKLQVAVDLLDSYINEGKRLTKQALGKYVTELKSRAKKEGKDWNIVTPEYAEDAVNKSNYLINLHDQFNEAAVIILQSDNGYNGKEFWDVLQSAGLKWGDGDLFHWINTSGSGDDTFFSVATSTQPGYFLPESVSAGQMNPTNLIFGFAIPRNPDPEHVFDAMYKVVEYSKSRLGGVIINKDGKPLDVELEKKRVTEIVKSMKQKKIVPGSDRALRMF